MNDDIRDINPDIPVELMRRRDALRHIHSEIRAGNLDAAERHLDAQKHLAVMARARLQERREREENDA